MLILKNFTNKYLEFATPPPGDGTRAFYESLFSQKPNSKMAMKWWVEHGLLSFEQQKALASKI